MNIYHKHHIIPKHMGGSDDESNIVTLTVEEHVKAHLKLYETHGKIEDLWSYYLLKGDITYWQGFSLLLVHNAKATHKKCKERKTGFFSSEQQSENGKKGGKKLAELKKTIFHCKETNPSNIKVSCIRCKKLFNKPWLARHKCIEN